MQPDGHEFHEMLLVRSREPIELDAQKIHQRFQQDSVRSTLQDVGIGSATGFNEQMNAHHQRLMQFYRASLHAYDGNRDAWARDIREVMLGDGGNPYYRWFVGE